MESKAIKTIQFSKQSFKQILEETYQINAVTVRIGWICLLLMTTIGSTSGELADETTILLNIKNVAWRNSSDLSSWSTINNTCSWKGVECDSANTTVIHLNLSNSHLSGPIPPELSQLPNLVTIKCENCGLTGSIPPELGQLSKLSGLLINNNSLSGEIRDTLGNLTSLVYLHLFSNNLTGPIPSQLGQLMQLTSFDLRYNKLTGSIPVSLANLKALKYLWLDNNFLSGEIPQNFTAVPNLKSLRLSNNNLSGPIPTLFSTPSSLIEIDVAGNFLRGEVADIYVSTNYPNFTRLFVQDNCLNGTFPATYNTGKLQYVTFENNCFHGTVCNPKCGIGSGGKGKNSTVRIVSIALGVVVGVLLLVGIPMFVVSSKRTRKSLNDTPDYQVPGTVQRYTLLEVKEATENLTTKLGEGAFATVYKAEFKGGTVAAVKHFNKKRPEENFQQEVEFLAHLNHRYLVNLIGFCQEQGELMLMYEFMNSGNLYESLHSKISHPGDPHGSKVPLTWDERVKILLNVARGIEYLHYGASPPLIHRDIKSANILLTDSDGKTLIAKLADFGLGKQTILESYEVVPVLGSNETPEPPATRIAGTPGYMDPEYLTAWKVSSKSDVFSYGVVMLEIVTGKLAIFIHMQERTSLVEWARPYLAGNQILTIVDPKLGSESIPEAQLVSFAALARRCIDLDSRNRPTIRGVLKTLSEIFRPDSDTRELSRELSSSRRSTDMTMGSLKISSRSYTFFESTEMTLTSSRSLEASSSHS